MILTCPGCVARFVVADSRIDPQSREVSHAACGTVWVLDGAPEAKVCLPAPDMEPLAVAEAPVSEEPVPEEAACSAESGPEMTASYEPVSEEPASEEPLNYKPALRMAAPDPVHIFPEFDRDRLREHLAWATTLPNRSYAKLAAAGASLSLAASMELALLFHREIGHVWPTMAHLYTTFGL